MEDLSGNNHPLPEKRGISDPLSGGFAPGWLREVLTRRACVGRLLEELDFEPLDPVQVGGGERKVASPAGLAFLAAVAGPAEGPCQAEGGAVPPTLSALRDRVLADPRLLGPLLGRWFSRATARPFPVPGCAGWTLLLFSLLELRRNGRVALALSRNLLEGAVSAEEALKEGAAPGGAARPAPKSLLVAGDALLDASRAARLVDELSGEGFGALGPKNPRHGVSFGGGADRRRPETFFRAALEAAAAWRDAAAGLKVCRGALKDLTALRAGRALAWIPEALELDDLGFASFCLERAGALPETIAGGLSGALDAFDRLDALAERAGVLGALANALEASGSARDAAVVRSIAPSLYAPGSAPDWLADEDPLSAAVLRLLKAPKPLSDEELEPLDEGFSPAFHRRIGKGEFDSIAAPQVTEASYPAGGVQEAQESSESPESPDVSAAQEAPYVSGAAAPECDSAARGGVGGAMAEAGGAPAPPGLASSGSPGTYVEALSVPASLGFPSAAESAKPGPDEDSRGQAEAEAAAEPVQDGNAEAKPVPAPAPAAASTAAGARPAPGGGPPPALQAHDAAGPDEKALAAGRIAVRARLESLRVSGAPLPSKAERLVLRLLEDGETDAASDIVTDCNFQAICGAKVEYPEELPPSKAKELSDMLQPFLEQADPFASAAASAPNASGCLSASKHWRRLCRAFSPGPAVSNSERSESLEKLLRWMGFGLSKGFPSAPCRGGGEELYACYEIASPAIPTVTSVPAMSKRKTLELPSLSVMVWRGPPAGLAEELGLWKGAGGTLALAISLAPLNRSANGRLWGMRRRTGLKFAAVDAPMLAMISQSPDREARIRKLFNWGFVGGAVKPFKEGDVNALSEGQLKCLSKAFAPSRGVIRFEGPAGSGKSRLMQTLFRTEGVAPRKPEGLHILMDWAEADAVSPEDKEAHGPLGAVFVVAAKLTSLPGWNFKLSASDNLDRLESRSAVKGGGTVLNVLVDGADGLMDAIMGHPEDLGLLCKIAKRDVPVSLSLAGRHLSRPMEQHPLSPLYALPPPVNMIYTDPQSMLNYLCSELREEGFVFGRISTAYRALSLAFWSPEGVRVLGAGILREAAVDAAPDQPPPFTVTAAHVDRAAACPETALALRELAFSSLETEFDASSGVPLGRAVAMAVALAAERDPAAKVFSGPAGPGTDPSGNARPSTPAMAPVTEEAVKEILAELWPKIFLGGGMLELCYLAQKLCAAWVLAQDGEGLRFRSEAMRRALGGPDELEAALAAVGMLKTPPELALISARRILPPEDSDVSLPTAPEGPDASPPPAAGPLSGDGPGERWAAALMGLSSKRKTPSGKLPEPSPWTIVEETMLFNLSRSGFGNKTPLFAVAALTRATGAASARRAEQSLRDVLAGSGAADFVNYGMHAYHNFPVFYMAKTFLDSGDPFSSGAPVVVVADFLGGDPCEDTGEGPNEFPGELLGALQGVASGEGLDVEAMNFSGGLPGGPVKEKFVAEFPMPDRIRSFVFLCRPADVPDRCRPGLNMGPVLFGSRWSVSAVEIWLAACGEDPARASEIVNLSSGWHDRVLAEAGALFGRPHDKPAGPGIKGVVPLNLKPAVDAIRARGTMTEKEIDRLSHLRKLKNWEGFGIFRTLGELSAIVPAGTRGTETLWMLDPRIA
ncbi:MAG: hypothetical protein LBQ12_04195 [Deltaproteobacteria bacterium]|jgi:hypothetical protein|nr:hypothetical protein [Deltaproteobacteria bacterium]